MDQSHLKNIQNCTNSGILGLQKQHACNFFCALFIMKRYTASAATFARAIEEHSITADMTGEVRDFFSNRLQK